MMIPPRPEPEPGEWKTETDKYGAVRRYRITGGIKEYEAEIITTHGTMGKTQLDTYNHTAHPDTKTHLDREEPAKSCPLLSGMKTDCTREKCAAYFGGGCTLSRGKAGRDTRGLQCPISKYHYPCREDCALYRNGCTLMTTIESEVN